MSQGAPIIGITTYGPDQADLPAVSLPTVYVEAVAAAGGVPVLLAPSEARAHDLLDAIDGLMLSGGGDVDPMSHSGGSHEAVYMVAPQRDHFEIALIHAALDRHDLPVLGICRGMQILNVALGGDLELHLPDVRGEQVVHRLPPRQPVLHDVRVDSGSVLEEIYGANEFPVCSWHHQEVKRLGKELVPIAQAADGVVEGLVHDGHPFVVGVQWHPEMQVADDPMQRKIFEALIDRSRRAG